MKITLLSLGLLTGGVVLAFLMVIGLLKPSFALGFLAYALSLIGLTLGLTVAIQHHSFRSRG
jgi:disulfide bond formation protein DsbB